VVIGGPHSLAGESDDCAAARNHPDHQRHGLIQAIRNPTRADSGWTPIALSALSEDGAALVIARA
jgi:hypothetical protein